MIYRWVSRCETGWEGRKLTHTTTPKPSAHQLLTHLDSVHQQAVVTGQQGHCFAQVIRQLLHGIVANTTCYRHLGVRRGAEGGVEEVMGRVCAYSCWHFCSLQSREVGAHLKQLHSLRFDTASGALNPTPTR